MLARLSIRDIVLIDRLDIDFASGLAVLTGETGAGKSILLDAFALALGALAHQGRVAAPTEGQGKGIEQDGFARTGLAGQDRKPAGEFDIEPFDQDDVADRQTRQHGNEIPSRDPVS